MTNSHRMHFLLLPILHKGTALGGKFWERCTDRLNTCSAVLRLRGSDWAENDPTLPGSSRAGTQWSLEDLSGLIIGLRTQQVFTGSPAAASAYRISPSRRRPI